VNGFKDFSSQQALINREVMAGLAQNTPKIKFVHEELNR
jgi:hypothetical protein